MAMKGCWALVERSCTCPFDTAERPVADGLADFERVQLVCSRCRKAITWTWCAAREQTPDAANHWQDKPDSDGLWWVVDKGKVEVVRVGPTDPWRLNRMHWSGNGQLHHDGTRHPLMVTQMLGDERGSVVEQFTGPWLKADVPQVPVKEDT